MSELFIKTTSLEDDRLDCEVVNLGTDNIEHSSIDLHTDDMEIGIRGKDGVGIKSIVTNESEEDGGKNEVTITLTNNNIHKFFIRNGSQYKLSLNDKDEIADLAAEKAYHALENKFATNEDVKNIVEESHDSVVFFEDYEGKSNIIVI